MKKCLIIVYLLFVILEAVAQDNVDSMAALQNYLQQNPQAAQSLQNNMQDSTLKDVASFLNKNPNLVAQLNKDMAVGNKVSATPPATQENEVSEAKNEEAAPKAPNPKDIDYYWEPKNPADDDVKKQMLRNETAFKSMVQGAFPLSPSQIKQLHNMLDETQRAAATEPFEMPPQPTSSSLQVNLAPGAVPPVIRLSRGFVSSLVFIDQTGAPWPIQAYDLGNPENFNISWDKKDNTLMVQARTSYSVANLAVKLKDLNTPVMLTLIAGQKVVDYRIDLRIQGFGPNAQTVVAGQAMPGQTSTLLLNILDGVPPKGAKRLKVGDIDSEAWIFDDALYFRTRAQVVSPAWMSKVSSADGMNAYEMPQTPLVLVSRHGKIVSIKLDGF